MSNDQPQPLPENVQRHLDRAHERGDLFARLQCVVGQMDDESVEAMIALAHVCVPMRVVEIRAVIEAAKGRRRPGKDWAACPYFAHCDDCDCGGAGGDR